jgi:uncharacterized membrane protein (UPF0127 family)
MPPRLRRLRCLPLAGPLRIAVAADRRARLLGLAFLRAPPARVALLLPRCRSVHTLGMRWPLDLVWLDGDGAPVRVDRGVRTGRVRTCRSARCVVEVPAGGANAVLTTIGG